MSASLNKVILIGRLGKDPEVRSTQGGDNVANFSLAVDETYKDRNGDKQKKTEWVNIVIWGKAVEAFVQPYLHKGDLVYVEGKLQTRSWVPKDGGEKKYTTEVNVSDIKSLQAPSNDQQQHNSTNKPAARPAVRPAQQPQVQDEDIPF